MKKQRKRKPFDKRAAWNKMRLVLASNCTEETDASQHSSIMIPVFLAIDALEHGTLDDEKFVHLVEMNAAAVCLCAIIAENGTKQVQDAMKAHEATIVAAGDALAAVGERRAKLGRFGATGNQLRAIRDAANIMSDISKDVPRGMVLRALKQAQDMTEEFFRTHQH